MITLLFADEIKIISEFLGASKIFRKLLTLLCYYNLFYRNFSHIFYAKAIKNNRFLISERFRADFLHFLYIKYILLAIFNL